MPVGMSYLALFVLLASMVVQGARVPRLQRVRAHPLFWPLVVYVSWTIVVLVFQPVFYVETPSNLLHGARIALTLALALALTRDEAVWAMRGFLLAAAGSVLVVIAHRSVGLPDWSVWQKLIYYAGNKSISNAILLSIVAGSALVLALASKGQVRILALLVAIGLLSLIVLTLPNRTSILVVFAALLATGIHQWRHYKLRLFAFLALATLVLTALITSVPAIQTRLAQGMGELQQASAGEVSQASWNVRVHLVRYTYQMIADRPWMGWGIGGWTEQWKKRVPPPIAELNMPHNDLLWMGAQAGVPGALSWLAIMLVACWSGWRRQDISGRLAFVAALTLLFSALVNSATRDAVIGLSLLWIVGLYLRLAADPRFHYSTVK